MQLFEFEVNFLVQCGGFVSCYSCYKPDAHLVDGDHCVDNKDHLGTIP